MKRIQTITLLAALSMGVGFSSSAHGDVLLVGSEIFDDSNNFVGGGSTSDSYVTTTASDLTVLMIIYRSDNGNQATAVTLDPGGADTPFTALGAIENFSATVSVWGAALGSVSSGQSIDFGITTETTNNRNSYDILHLSGALLDGFISDTDSALGSSVAVTTQLDGVRDGSFLISALAHTQDGSSFSTTTTYDVTDQSALRARFQGAYGYSEDVSAGDYTQNWDNDDSGQAGKQVSIVSVAIRPIPEPASAALLGLAGLALLRRRRRA